MKSYENAKCIHYGCSFSVSGLYSMEFYRMVFSGAETVLSYLGLYQSFTTGWSWFTKNMVKARSGQLLKKLGWMCTRTRVPGWSGERIKRTEMGEAAFAPCCNCKRVLAAPPNEIREVLILKKSTCTVLRCRCFDCVTKTMGYAHGSKKAEAGE